jgi:hypothetical protein
LSIRIKCTCGTRLKVPDTYSGKSVRCSVCSETVFVPTPTTTGIAIPANQETAAWIRVECKCGKSIKAPAEWAGKSGNCPRCGEEVIMPFPDSIAKALGGGETPTPQPKPGPTTAQDKLVPGQNLKLSGLIDLTNREEVKIIDGLAPAVRAGRRDQRAKNMASSTGKQVRYYKQSSMFERLSSYRFTWMPFIYHHPATTIIVSLLIISLCGWFMDKQFTEKKEEPIPQFFTPPEMVYFYDVDNAEVFTHTLADPPPVRTPKQAAEDPEPKGVRAFIYSCGQCTPDKWFIAYVERFNATAQDAWQRRIEARHLADVPSPAEDIPAAKLGRFVATLEDKHFVAVTSEESKDILKRATANCPDGNKPVECFPPKAATATPATPAAPATAPTTAPAK